MERDSVWTGLGMPAGRSLPTPGKSRVSQKSKGISAKTLGDSEVGCKSLMTSGWVYKDPTWHDWKHMEEPKLVIWDHGWDWGEPCSWHQGRDMHKRKPSGALLMSRQCNGVGLRGEGLWDSGTWEALVNLGKFSQCCCEVCCQSIWGLC